MNTKHLFIIVGLLLYTPHGYAPAEIVEVRPEVSPEVQIEYQREDYTELQEAQRAYRERVELERQQEIENYSREQLQERLEEIDDERDFEDAPEEPGQETGGGPTAEQRTALDAEEAIILEQITTLNTRDIVEQKGAQQAFNDIVGELNTLVEADSPDPTGLYSKSRQLLDASAALFRDLADVGDEHFVLDQVARALEGTDPTPDLLKQLGKQENADLRERLRETYQRRMNLNPTPEDVVALVLLIDAPILHELGITTMDALHSTTESSGATTGREYVDIDFRNLSDHAQEAMIDAMKLRRDPSTSMITAIDPIEGTTEIFVDPDGKIATAISNRITDRRMSGNSYLLDTAVSDLATEDVAAALRIRRVIEEYTPDVAQFAQDYASSPSKINSFYTLKADIAKLMTRQFLSGELEGEGALEELTEIIKRYEDLVTLKPDVKPDINRISSLRRSYETAREQTTDSITKTVDDFDGESGDATELQRQLQDQVDALYLSFYDEAFLNIAGKNTGTMNDFFAALRGSLDVIRSIAEAKAETLMVSELEERNWQLLQLEDILSRDESQDVTLEVFARTRTSLLNPEQMSQGYYRRAQRAEEYWQGVRDGTKQLTKNWWQVDTFYTEQVATADELLYRTQQYYERAARYYDRAADQNTGQATSYKATAAEIREKLALAPFNAEFTSEKISTFRESYLSNVFVDVASGVEDARLASTKVGDSLERKTASIMNRIDNCVSCSPGTKSNYYKVVELRKYKFKIGSVLSGIALGTILIAAPQQMKNFGESLGGKLGALFS